MQVSKIEDLERIRQQISRDFSLRTEGMTTKINLHMGTCGIAAGANKLQALITRRIEEKGLAI